MLTYILISGMSYRFVDRDGYYCEKTFSETTTALSRFTTTSTSRDGTSVVLSLIDITDSVCPEDRPCYSVTKSSKTVLTAGTARANPTVVFWQSSDLSLFPRDYASSLAAVIGVPFGSSATSSSLPSTPGPSMTSQDTNSGLSPGAKAGIGVGVGIFVIFSIVFLLFLWRRRKHQRQRKQDAQIREQEPSAENGVSEMDGDANGSKRFVGGHWRAETEASSAPVEAGSTSVHIVPGPPVELDGTHTSRGE
jgi:hypothetical protein